MSDLPSSNSTKKPPPDRKKSLRLDEWIAIIVSLAALGSIFFSIVTEKESNTGAVASLNGNEAEEIASQKTDSESRIEELTFNRVSRSRFPQEAIAQFETQPKLISNTTTIPVIATSAAAAPMRGPAVAPAAMPGPAVAPAAMPGPAVPPAAMPEPPAPAPMPGPAVPPAAMPEPLAPAPMPGPAVPPAAMPEAVAPAPMPGPAVPPAAMPEAVAPAPMTGPAVPPAAMPEPPAPAPMTGPAVPPAAMPEAVAPAPMTGPAVAPAAMPEAVAPAPMTGPAVPPAAMPEAVAPAPMTGPAVPPAAMPEAVAPAPMTGPAVPPAAMPEAVAPAPMTGPAVPPAAMTEAVAPAPMTEPPAPAPMPGPAVAPAAMPEPPAPAPMTGPAVPPAAMPEAVAPAPMTGSAVAPAPMESQNMSAAEMKQDSQKKLSLPIAFNSEKGDKLLVNSSSRADYLPLTMQFVSQDNLAYCGVASAVMVLNALKVPAPAVEEFHKRHRFFTQKNVFDNPQARKIISPEMVTARGMTLKQLTRFVRSHGIPAEAYYSSYTGLDEFRKKLVENLEQDYNFVLVNYSRETIGQGKSGHISPIAAYDEESDRFLILDVSRYQYPPVWVTAEQLWQATNTVDSASGKTRGFVWVGR